MKTRIIVDSTADLVPEIKARVSTVPLTVHFGQEEYIDGVTIDNKTFYEKLIESDVLPTTSQATPDAFMKEYEKVKQAEEAAVVITLASKFSGTYQSAVIAAAENGLVGKGRDVTVKVRGGDLFVRYTSDGMVTLTGGVKQVFEGYIEF